MPRDPAAHAAVEIEHFEKKKDVARLFAALQGFRVESTRQSSRRRRATLNAGRTIAARAIRAIESEMIEGDVTGLMIESGLFLLECARPTVKEFGAPPKMLDENANAPDDRLGPNVFADDTIDGLTWMARGYGRARRDTPNHPMLAGLRDYIINVARTLLIDKGDIEDDMRRLSHLMGIAQVLEDDIFFATVALRLSGILRSGKRPDVAETLMKKALQWPRVTGAHREALLGELASALSEQEKFAEAEKVQNEILGD